MTAFSLKRTALVLMTPDHIGYYFPAARPAEDGSGPAADAPVQRGAGTGWKWFFYLYYPAHTCLLFLLARFVPG